MTLIFKDDEQFSKLEGLKLVSSTEVVVILLVLVRSTLMKREGQGLVNGG